MLKIIKKIINKNCKHKEIDSTFEAISSYTYCEYQHCHKCHKTRKIIESDGCKVIGEWK